MGECFLQVFFFSECIFLVSVFFLLFFFFVGERGTMDAMFVKHCG